MSNTLDQAVEIFRNLLQEQMQRATALEQAAPSIDYTQAQRIVVGMVPGDGIGPIIMGQAKRVLEVLLAPQLAQGRIELRAIEGLTIENRIAAGKAIPDDILQQIKQCDVLLKGPTTTPKGGTMESANVSLRRELDLYANVRPVCVPQEGIDWMFFRENTEGEYTLGSRGIDCGNLAVDFKVTTDAGTKRIARAALEYAVKNGKTRLAIVTKANILKKTDGRFSELCHLVAQDYPTVTCEDYYIDIMTANLVNPKVRGAYQVFVLPNLYGDIITDEAAQIQGGVGTAGSANIGNRYAMFEAIHGSGLRMMEEGREQYANPASVLKAAEMMLRHIAMTEQADCLLAALNKALDNENVRITGRADGATCVQFADYVIAQLQA